MFGESLGIDLEILRRWRTGDKDIESVLIRSARDFKNCGFETSSPFSMSE